MNPTLQLLLTEARHTLQDPRSGVRRVIALGLPMQARWLGLGLIAVCSAILTHLSFGLIPVDDRDVLSDLMQSPFRTAALQGVLLLAIVHMTYWLGRARGGTGRFADALVVLVWLQLLMLGLQVVQLVVQVALPPLAGPVNLAGFAIFVWLLCNFIAELHGFKSLIAVFGGIVLGMFLLGFALALVIFAVSGGPGG